MTHFVGMVVARDESHMEQLLEPYSEHREVAPYVDDTEWVEALSKCAAFRVSKGEDISQSTVLDILNDWSGTGWSFNRREQRFEHSTTYNPDSLWDWYVIGGRWDKHYTESNTITIAESLKFFGPDTDQVPPRVLVDSYGILKRGSEGWFGYTENADRFITDSAWSAAVIERLDRSAPDALVYFVDFHI